MNGTPFSTQVLTGRPLLVIAQYGNSIVEVMNLLIASLVRAQIRIPIYTDNIYPIENTTISVYETGLGIILMTTVRDNIPYSPNIIPIYVVCWGIRTHDITRYHEWIKSDPIILSLPADMAKNPPHLMVESIPVPITGITQESLNMKYSKFSVSKPDTTVAEGGWISPDVLYNLHEYSPKFAMLQRNVTPPCVIFCPYVQKYGLRFIEVMLRQLGVSIYSYPQNPRALTLFEHNRFSILLTNTMDPLRNIMSAIPIHIVSLDSDSGMSLFMEPHYHETIYVYMGTSKDNIITPDTAQYTLLSSGIQDSNQAFTALLQESQTLHTDQYNNLYVR